ncbi:MAG: DUF1360 domain-containing protein [bacterium]|nr:DUF1360 domain-containing protein [bacterium]
MTAPDLALLILASFRVTHLIVFDTITAPVREALRRPLGPLITCFWCSGFWVSLALFLGYVYLPLVFRPVVIVFAIAGGQSFLEALLRYMQSLGGKER